MRMYGKQLHDDTESIEVDESVNVYQFAGGQAGISRALKFPVGDSTDPTVPVIAARAGKVLSFDPAGKPAVLSNPINLGEYPGIVAESYAEAVILTGLSDGQQVHILSRSAPLYGLADPFDGGGGEFGYCLGDYTVQVAADPLGGVYLPLSSDPTGASGCLVRKYDKKNTYAGWWGATPGNETGPAMQAALTVSRGKILNFPKGTFLTNIQLILYSDNKISGAAQTIIKASSVMDSVLHLPRANNTESTADFGISNIYVHGNDLATYCIHLINQSMANFDTLSGVRTSNAVSHGIFLSQCQGAVFRSIRSDNNGGSGIYSSGNNSARFYGITCRFNGEDGFYVTSESGYSGAISIFGGTLEANLRDGLSFSKDTATVVPSYAAALWIEQNIRDGVRGDDSRFTLTGCRISGVGVGTNYGVNLLSGGPYYVNHNYIARASGDISYVGPDGNGVRSLTTNSIIGPNTNGSFAVYADEISEALSSEIVSNGDFELGDTTGWTASSATISADASAAKNGSYGMEVDASVGGASAQQSITLSDAGIYKAVINVYLPSGTAPGGVDMQINNGSTVVGSSSILTTDEWVTQTFYFQALGSSGQIKFRALAGGGVFYVDDISVKRVLRSGKSATMWEGGSPRYFYVLDGTHL